MRSLVPIFESVVGVVVPVPVVPVFIVPVVVPLFVAPVADFGVV
jgi:hypothetical protein